MASATKEHPKWDKAVEDVRQLVAEMPEPHRTAASRDIKLLISDPVLYMSEKDLEGADARNELFAELPLSLDDLADASAGAPMGWTEVGREIQTLALEVRELKGSPAAGTLNPPVDKCDCNFTADPELHDRLIGIEGMTGPDAAELVATFISDDDPGTGNEGQMFEDPHDFGRFVAQHNWVDPVGMAALAGAVDFAMDQAWKPERVRGECTG